MTLVTLTKFAERRTPAVRLRLDHAEQFPPVLLKDRNDPHHHGLPLVLIPEESGGPGGGAPLSQRPGYTRKLTVPNAARLEAARPRPIGDC
ncbi:MAG: hypothetical protein JNK29_07270 [Anaerolineales bacterium]|nr:hypothetical protein [Anaerolineales bacterium]